MFKSTLFKNIYIKKYATAYVIADSVALSVCLHTGVWQLGGVRLQRHFTSSDSNTKRSEMVQANAITGDFNEH